MADILVDTDVLVDDLRGAQQLEPSHRVHYSVVTRAELFAGSTATDLVRAAASSRSTQPPFPSTGAIGRSSSFRRLNA